MKQQGEYKFPKASSKLLKRSKGTQPHV